MKIGILFEHFGGYHFARLRGANEVLNSRGWNIEGIEVYSNSEEHPWKTESLRDEVVLHSLEGHPAGLRSLLSAGKFDVLAIPGWGFEYSRVALSWCRQNGISAILLSESRADDAPRIWMKEKLKHWLWVRHFSSALVGGDVHQEYLEQLGFETRLIFRGYDVVDNDYFSVNARRARDNPAAARTRLGLQQEITEPFYLCISRFIPRKNIASLIEAYALYRDRSSKPKDLIVLGSGVEREGLIHLAIDRGVEQSVFFPGFATYEETGDWYGLAEALIHPALDEPWGLVVNEAMAAELPVLVSRNCGCYDALVDEGVNGFGFDPLNIEELAEKMLTLERQPNSPLGHHGLRKVKENFEPRDFGMGLGDAITAALNQG